MIHAALQAIPVRSLTPRQLEVAQDVKRGLKPEAIARHLGVSIHTVRTHIRGIALLLENPHGLPALTLVRRWARESSAISSRD
jgi:DNA-binding NarL/FixJ family response regulator